MLRNAQVTEGQKLEIGGILVKRLIDFSLLLPKWEKFYKKTYGRKYDFSGIFVPQADDIFAWPICMASDISAEDWLSAGKDQLPFWKYTDKKLDDLIDASFGRDGWEEDYIVRLRANEEADDDLRNISAIKIAEMGINTATLKERLALGRFLYWYDRKLIDKRVVTLLSGSRYSDGDVPGVYWHGGKLRVGRYNPGVAHDGLRARRAVSLIF